MPGTVLFAICLAQATLAQWPSHAQLRDADYLNTPASRNKEALRIGLGHQQGEDSDPVRLVTVSMTLWKRFSFAVVGSDRGWGGREPQALDLMRDGGRPCRGHPHCLHCCAVGKPFLSSLCMNTIHLPLPTSNVGVWAVGIRSSD